MVIILHVEIADLLSTSPVRVGCTSDCQPQSAGSVVVADNAAEKAGAVVVRLLLLFWSGMLRSESRAAGPHDVCRKVFRG